MKTIKINTWIDISKEFTGIVEFPAGSIFWIKDGKRHREDGPAVEYSNGTKKWYLEGIEIYSYIYHLYKTYLILDISPHPIYPLVKIHKVLLKDSIKENILISGMAEYER